MNTLNNIAPITIPDTKTTAILAVSEHPEFVSDNGLNEGVGALVLNTATVGFIYGVVDTT